MYRFKRLLLLFLLISPGFVSRAQSEVIPGRWEKVEALPPATEVLIVLNSGDRQQGTVSKTTSDGVELSLIGGGSRSFPKDAVRRVIRVGISKTDPVWNGLAIGAAVGAGSYLAGHAALCCAPSEGHDVGGALIFAGIGMGIGALIDALAHSEQEVVYRARGRGTSP